MSEVGRTISVDELRPGQQIILLGDGYCEVVAVHKPGEGPERTVEVRRRGCSHTYSIHLWKFSRIRTKDRIESRPAVPKTEEVC